MSASATATCSRCGHEPTHQAKPYVVWLHLPPGQFYLGIFYNLVVAVFSPRRPVCSWCHAVRTPRAQESHRFDAFVHHVRHSREEMALRRRVSAMRPQPSTGRWNSEDRAEILDYLARRDNGRCGLCAMPLPTSEGQVEHVVPKRFGIFDFSGGSARAGRTLESKLHHVDNLQAAHQYCNRAKGNTPSAVKWRHPLLPPLPVARQIGSPRTYLWVPEREHHSDVPTPKSAGTSASPPPSPSPVGASARPASRTRRGIRVALCLLSVLLAVSALASGLQNSSPFGVASMVFVAFCFGFVAWRLGARTRTPSYRRSARGEPA